MAIVRVLNAEIESISFAQNVQAAIRINAYVAQKTHNMIKHVVDPNSISPATTMILLNCIYFKGTWQYTFPKKQTYPGRFFIDETNTVPVKFMTQKTEFMFGYLEDFDGASILSLPYKNSDMTMLFVLPRRKNGLPDIVNNMTNFDWSTIDQFMGLVEVKVTIPKFNVTFDQTIDGVLKNVSIRTIEVVRIGSKGITMLF
jgi:serpin B